jgi:hypothetical protein
MVGGVLSAVNARAGRRVLVWGLAAAILAAVLDFMPLFDVLGYDFAFAMGLLVALASVDIGCGVVAAARRGGSGLELPRLMGRATALALGITALPLLLSLANALRVRNCNLGAGLAFFLLLPLGTAVMGAGAGVIAGVAFPRRGRLVAFAIPLVSVGWSLLRLYLDPPVFAFDPFGGYFPGPIYDEALRPSATLLLFRLCNLVWLAAALAVTWTISAPAVDGPPLLQLRQPLRWRRRQGIAAAVLVVASLVLFARSASFGFHLGKADLLRLLDGERKDAHVVLRYATAAGISPGDLDLTMEDLDFRYRQLRDLFGVEPPEPITVYLFTNAEQKKALVGAANTLYAKPWTREIFVQIEAFPSRRLRHEMAHVFAGSFGDPIFGVSLRVRWAGPLPIPKLASGLIEGIAEAADFTDPDGGSTTHQEAAAIVADGKSAPLAELMGPAFSAVSGPRAYTLAGSFTRFLLDTRGGDKLRAIYQSAGDFQGVYGVPLATLETEWRTFLAAQTLSAEQQARAREQFRRPAIFKKICAREQAARVGEARALLGSAPARSLRLLEQACRDDPGEPTFRVDLAQATAATGDQRGALALLAAIERDGEATRPVRARAAALAAAIHFHENDPDNARVALRDVLASATDEGERRQANAKLRALDDEAARRTLGRALFGTDVAGAMDPVLMFFLMSEFSRLHPDDALGPYLLGRQLAARDPALALPQLRIACEDPFPGRALSPDFRRECLRLTMLAAYRAGDLARSAKAAGALAAEATDEAERLRAGDFQARIAWRQTKN